VNINKENTWQLLLSNQQVRNADKLTIESGISGFELLSAAGRQVYEVVSQLATASDRILVACGSGNNGGDGLIAAALLLEAGFDVSVVLSSPPETVTGDARLALNALGQPVSSLADSTVDNYSIILDAILGSGIDRPVRDDLARWIALVNNSNALIVSVDIPTGICSDSGVVMGTAVAAQHTVTFFRKKTGHVLYPGRQHCGQIHLRQIGIDDSVLDQLQPRCFENGTALWQASLPQPSWNSHKYTRGHVVVATGDALSTGAARLAARAALRAGAGLVTLACPSSAVSVVASHVSCEMLETADTAAEFKAILEDERISAVVVGPGLGIGSATQELVQAALRSTASVVLDADALTSFENCEADLFQLISESKNEVVLTPHFGEFKRLFGGCIRSETTQATGSGKQLVVDNKITMSIEAARISGATVVHKGPDTVIATPSSLCVINTNAPPWLSTAGSGDVLAGTIAGYLAQGVTGFKAASIGCWMHAEAASVFGPGLIASDIAARYPQIINRLMCSLEKAQH